MLFIAKTIFWTENQLNCYDTLRFGLLELAQSAAKLFELF